MEPTVAATATPAAATATSATTDAEVAAERRAIALTADARVEAGVPALRPDAGLGAIARSRATDMRDRGYFAHVAPDGRTVFDMLTAASVAWASGAEVIGWNDVPAADASAARVVADWLASSPHRSDLLAPGSDRIGLASAYDPASGRWMWAAVLVESADRTAPVAAVRVAATGRPDASGHRAVIVAWTAHDVPGAGIATGVRDVTVQVRVGAGRWRTALQAGAGSSLRRWLPWIGSSRSGSVRVTVPATWVPGRR